MDWESSDVFRFDLEPLLQVKRGQANLKVLIPHCCVNTDEQLPGNQ